MTLSFSDIVIDCSDPHRVGSFWAEALGVPLDGPDEEGICAIEGHLGCPEILFIKVPESKAGKNRVHIDLRPDDQAYEVERLVSLGAHPVGVGQRDVTWVVLADVEGNEFCVLRSREKS